MITFNDLTERLNSINLKTTEISSTIAQAATSLETINNSPELRPYKDGILNAYIQQLNEIIQSNVNSDSTQMSDTQNYEEDPESDIEENEEDDDLDLSDFDLD